MKLISHRGNIKGRNIDLENTESYILKAVAAGYEVEVDIQSIEGNIVFIGHDCVTGNIPLFYLQNYPIWAHAKNIEALHKLLKLNVHCFWHETDKYTITSHGYIWAYPTALFPEGVIAVLPEMFEKKKLEHVAGICSDFIEDFK